MSEAKTLKAYRREVRAALDDDFLRAAFDAFAEAYPAGRSKAFGGLDPATLIDRAANDKDASIPRLMALYAQFKSQAEARGCAVHLAKDGPEANRIIASIAEAENCRTVIKAKSMTAEEIFLNRHLESQGLKVIESDLGEWIIQLRREGPSHMVMPAIHLSRAQVADLFTEVTQQRQEPDIDRLVKVARRELRPWFASADMGVTGANFALADSGLIGLVTNEGNARLVTTLPRLHVALVGLDKLLPDLRSALDILTVLPRNATGQAITAYVTWLGGAPRGPNAQRRHIVFLDNGRLALAKDPLFSQALRCIRCGACANVCPVYRLVGGHTMGHIYMGPIGLVLTYFFHGSDAARQLIQNCANCGACKKVCAANIDLPDLIQAVRARLVREDGSSAKSALIRSVMTRRPLFHKLLRFASRAQRPLTGNGPYMRHLPFLFFGDQSFRSLPALAPRAFRDTWKKRAAKPDDTPASGHKVVLFAGCAHDFIYPDQLEAGLKVMAAKGASVDFPAGQTCCGLPLHMMGEDVAVRAIARQNLTAVPLAGCDYIVTLCASCASFLNNHYPGLAARENDPALAAAATAFAAKVIDFSSFARNILQLSGDDFLPSPETVAYHSACHLCRGLGVTREPRDLIRATGANYQPTRDEDVCCGFGGSYSLNFPEISRELLTKKLADATASGATRLVADCPGCVLQLRGGARKKKPDLMVGHIAELLAERLKPGNQ